MTLSVDVEVDGVVEKASPVTFVNKMRDQTEEMERNIRYAATLSLPKVKLEGVRLGKVIIVGGAPSAAKAIAEIAAHRVAGARIIAVNWAHNWLINNGIVPDICLLFEIDVDPTRVLEALHPDVDYYVCSLCHPTTFDALKGYKRYLWHASVDPVKTSKALHECFPGEPMVGGGQTTFSRTIPLGVVLGYRDFEVFGVDSSFDDDASKTHLDGYPTNTKVDEGVYVWTYNQHTGEKRRFKTLPYLALQARHFYEFCHRYHMLFKLKIHGNGLLRFMHETDFPEQYR